MKKKSTLNLKSVYYSFPKSECLLLFRKIKLLLDPPVCMEVAYETDVTKKIILIESSK